MQFCIWDNILIPAHSDAPPYIPAKTPGNVSVMGEPTKVSSRTADWEPAGPLCSVGPAFLCKRRKSLPLPLQAPEVPPSSAGAGSPPLPLQAPEVHLPGRSAAERQSQRGAGAWLCTSGTLFVGLELECSFLGHNIAL